LKFKTAVHFRDGCGGLAVN